LRKNARRAPAGLLPFDLRSLETFLAVAEARSFTGAARQLGLTQSAVSQTIGQLERQSRLILIDRKLKPLALTVAGAALRERAQSLLGEARRIMPRVRETASLKLPIVRIGLIESLLPLLAPALGIELRFYAEQLSILSGVSDAHRQGLVRRMLDIAIAGDAMEDVDGLERHPILQEPYVLLLPRSYGVRGHIDLKRLAAELPFVRYTERSPMGRQIELYLRRRRLEIPLGHAYDGTHGVVPMVDAGLGWAITTPLCLYDVPPAADRTRCVVLPTPGLARNLTLVARRGELGSIPARVAGLACRVLKTQLLPALARIMPEAQKRIEIG